MFAIASLVAFLLALILHFIGHGLAKVVLDCILFGAVFLAAYFALPPAYGGTRAP